MICFNRFPLNSSHCGIKGHWGHQNCRKACESFYHGARQTRPVPKQSIMPFINDPPISPRSGRVAASTLKSRGVRDLLSISHYFVTKQYLRHRSVAGRSGAERGLSGRAAAASAPAVDCILSTLPNLPVVIIVQVFFASVEPLVSLWSSYGILSMAMATDTEHPSRGIPKAFQRFSLLLFLHCTQ